MDTTGQAVQKEQPKMKKPITIDIDSLAPQVAERSAELQSLKEQGLLIFDASTCQDVASRAMKAKELIAKTQEIFKPAKDAMDLAASTLKSSVSILVDPATKFEEAARKEVEQWLRDNPDESVDNARIQKSKWKLEVSDPKALLLSGIKVINRKIDGKMTQIIDIDPQIFALFEYKPAKGNSLASAMTTALNLPGCKAAQDDMLVLKEKE